MVHVRDIVLQHWAKYGRNYYSRYDYEGVSSEDAKTVMDNMKSSIKSGELKKGCAYGSFEV